MTKKAEKTNQVTESDMSASQDSARAEAAGSKGKVTRIKLIQPFRRAEREYRDNEILEVDASEATWFVKNQIGIVVDEAGVIEDEDARKREGDELPAQKMQG